MKFKLDYYNENKIKKLKKILFVLIGGAILVLFILRPSTTLYKNYSKLSKKKSEGEKIEKELAISKEAKVKYLKKIKLKRDKKEKLVLELKEKSFYNSIDFEMTFQNILDKLEITTLSTKKKQLDQKNNIGGTLKFTTDYTLKGSGSQIGLLYNLIENSNSLMLVKNSQFRISKEGKNQIKEDKELVTDLTLGYYILTEKGELREKKRVNLVNLIKKYDQKRDIFKMSLNKGKKKKKKKKKKVYKEKNRFELIGIANLENTSSAIIYYHSKKGGSERLVLSSRKSMILDKVKYTFLLNNGSVIVRKNGSYFITLEKK